MRYFLSGHQPSGARLLLVESGSRSLAENLLPHLTASWASQYPIDLVTCYGGLPAGFPPDTKVFRVTDYGAPGQWRELVRQLQSRDYAYTGMICSAEPIMTKWKWLIAFRIPAKVFIVNENGDYFWLHRENTALIREFALVRMGLEGAGAIRTFGRLLLFPFTLLFLMVYAIAVHARRKLRTL